MRKTVRKYHRKDGSVTKSTTYSHKNIFGTRVYETYTERIQPKEHRPIKIKALYIAAAFAAVIVAVFIAIIITAETILGKICAAFILAAALALTGIITYKKYFKSRVQNDVQAVVADAEHWYCPECDYKNSISDRYCKSCNYKYIPKSSGKARKSGAASFEAELKEWMCPECGAKNAESSRYCKVCSSPRGDNK